MFVKTECSGDFFVILLLEDKKIPDSRATGGMSCDYKIDDIIFSDFMSPFGRYKTFIEINIYFINNARTSDLLVSSR